MTAEATTLTRASLAAIKGRTRGIPVAFVIPPSEFLKDQRVFPFTGLLTVAAELEKNGNHVEVVDLSGYSNYDEIVAHYASLRKGGIDTFGITATTPQLPAAEIVRRAIKEANPDAKVILGGTHATLAYTGWKQDNKHGRVARGTGC